MVFVYQRFELDKKTIGQLKQLKDPFKDNPFGEIVFYRTYSRTKETGGQETWLDVVIRVINGVFSIRKDWYIKNHINWDEDYWQNYANDMAITMFKMYWLPPGRGLWAMGTDFVYQEGSMALNNCGFVELSDDLAEDICWMIDALMLGVGVGFEPIRNDNFEVYLPKGYFNYVIPDSREGWVNSIRLLINAFIKSNQKEPRFDYSLIRSAGNPIKRFGGISSGPEPLMLFHDQIRYFFYRYYNWKNNNNDYYDIIMLKTDLANTGGHMVVSGNVRRSAELCKGKITDKTFLNLKQYQNPMFAYREAWGGMSNNAAGLEKLSDFDHLGEIAKRVIHNAEPSVINLQNFSLARVGKRDFKNFDLKIDLGKGLNPCSEQILENYELCTLADTLPTKCPDNDTWLKVCEYAAVYVQTVTLLPTHQSKTNKVMSKNRRTGIGLMDFVGWKHKYSTHEVTRLLRLGYKIIWKKLKQLAEESGVPEAIRFTSVKPNGTTAKIAKVRSGAGYSNFKYMIRRIRVQQNTSFYDILHKANIPHEPDLFSANTEVFEYPLSSDDGTKSAEEVTLWEQAMNLVLLQREWSNNSVSNTLMFKSKWLLRQIMSGKNECEQYIQLLKDIQIELPLDNCPSEIIDQQTKTKLWYDNNGVPIKIEEYNYNFRHEEDDIEPVLSAIVPLIKTCSLSPHTPKGVYKQMPEEGITKEEYERRIAEIKPIDWSSFVNNNVNIETDKYCTGDKCEITIGDINAK